MTDAVTPTTIDHLHLIEPEEGATVDGLAVTFGWTDAPAASSYRLQVASDPAFDHLQFDADLGRTHSITLYDVLPLDGPELLWRVEARDRSDQAVWSPAARFRAVSNFAEFVLGKPSGETARESAGAAGAVSGAPGPPDVYAPRSTMGLVAMWIAGSVALALLIILKVLLA